MITGLRYNRYVLVDWPCAPFSNMGMNNIARFFRNSLESLHTIPRQYNLVIDATLLLIPMLKTSHTVDEFLECFDRYFDEQTELKRVIVSATEIFVGVDYYYPAMKQDTCRKRQREYKRQQERQQQQQQQQQPKVVNPESKNPFHHHHHNHHYHNKTVKPTLKIVPISIENNEAQRYRSSLSTTTTTTTADQEKKAEPGCSSSANTISESSSSSSSSPEPLQPSSASSLHLKQIREFIEPLFQRSLVRWHAEFGVAAQPLPRVVFDVQDYGEGEIKCFRHKDWQNRDIPTIVLSNDNDVLLMILMHGAMNRLSRKTKFLRIATIGTTEHCVLQNLSLRKLLLLIDQPNCWPERFSTEQMQVYEHNVWILVVWLIATYGSDYVYAIRAESENVTRGWMDAAVRFYRDFTNQVQYIELNPHNYFFVMTILMDVIASTNCANPFAAAMNRQGELFCMNHYPLEYSEGVLNDRTMSSVYHWCVRVYWNVLYLQELPIRFSENFMTDRHVPVNLYVSKQYINEQTVRSLTQRQRQQLHNMFCLYPTNLRRYEQISPARPASG